MFCVPNLASYRFAAILIRQCHGPDGKRQIYRMFCFDLGVIHQGISRCLWVI